MNGVDAGDHGNRREPPALTYAAAADLLGCSTAYIRGLVRRGELRATESSRRIAQQELESYAIREGLAFRLRLPGL